MLVNASSQSTPHSAVLGSKSLHCTAQRSGSMPPLLGPGPVTLPGGPAMLSILRKDKQARRWRTRQEKAEHNESWGHGEVNGGQHGHRHFKGGPSTDTKVWAAYWVENWQRIPLSFWGPQKQAVKWGHSVWRPKDPLYRLPSSVSKVLVTGWIHPTLKNIC